MARGRPPAAMLAALPRHLLKRMTIALVLMSACLAAALAAAGYLAVDVRHLRRQLTDLQRQDAQVSFESSERARAAAELGHALTHEVASVRHETFRLRALVGDAIGDLAASLEELSRQTRVHDAVMARLLRRDEPGASATHNVRRVSTMSAGLIRSMTDTLAETARQRDHLAHLTTTLVQHLDALAAHQSEVGAMEETAKVLARSVAEEAVVTERGRNRLEVAAAGLRRLAQRAAGFGEELRAQLPAARATASRVGEVVARPIVHDGRLPDSMRAQSTRLLEEMSVVNGTIEAGLREVESAGHRINAAIGSAVRCLQIDDIASQSLDLVEGHLARIESIADEASALAHATRPRTGADWRSPVRQPLSQVTMLEGSVELF